MKDGKLEAKDLMIGDWILFHGHFTQVSIRLLDTINDGLEVSPIPLTPEILEKHGWYFDDLVNEWYSNNHASRLYGRDCSSLSMFDGSVVVGYVHELQGALKCCGLSELAGNFKM